MFPVLVRSSKDVQTNATATNSKPPLQSTEQLSNTARLLRDFEHHRAGSLALSSLPGQMNEYKYSTLNNMPSSSFDDSSISTYSDDYERNRDHQRDRAASLKRYNSDQELPTAGQLNRWRYQNHLNSFPFENIDHRHNGQEANVGGTQIAKNGCSDGGELKPDRKTFSTLFMAKEDPSLVLSGSRLDSTDKSAAPAALNLNANRRTSIIYNNYLMTMMMNNNYLKRQSVITIDRYSVYNSASSLNSFYGDAAYAFNYDEAAALGGGGAHVIDGISEENNDGEHDVNENNIKYVSLFSILYCWCFPLTGILAIVFSCMSRKQYERKNYSKSKKYLNRSELFLVLTFVFGFTLICAFFVYMDFTFFKKSGVKHA